MNGGTETSLLAPPSPRAYALDPLKDLRHKEARSARDIEEWLAWLELGGTSPRTLDAYERTVAALVRANPEKAMEDFAVGDLARFLTSFPAKSRRIRKAHVSSWFKWAYKMDQIPANPVEKLPVMKQPAQPHIEVFTEAEQFALCALPSPDGALMELLFGAGLRKAEAIHLRVRRLDFDNRVVIVKEGAKGSKDRLVPMTKKLAAKMAELVLIEGLEAEEYLWYDKPGGGWAKTVRRSKPIGETVFGRWWTRCLYAADVGYRKPHTTRHTFATRWRQRGLQLDLLQQLMGHASISTTSDLYVHTKVTEIASRMDALLEVVQ